MQFGGKFTLKIFIVVFNKTIKTDEQTAGF